MWQLWMWRGRTLDGHTSRSQNSNVSIVISLVNIALWVQWAGLGSIPFFQFNSNSVIFNSNSNSTTHNKFQFQFQFQRFQFQFQFQFWRFQIQPQLQKWPVEVFREIDYNYNSKVYVVVYKIIVINTFSLISLVNSSWPSDALLWRQHIV